MRRSPKIAAPGALVALALALSACASGTATPAEPAESAEPGAEATPSTGVESTGPVTLDFWYAVGGTAADALMKQVEAFNTTNEHDITVNAIFQGNYVESIAKLTSAVQSGDTPVLLQGGDTFASFLRDSGLATPPESIGTFDGEPFNPSGIVPAAANYYTFEDELWAVPVMVSQPAIFFDPALLDAAGKDSGTPPASIGELFDWAEDIYEATGTPGLVFHQNEWWNEQFSAVNGVVYCTPQNGLGGAPADAFDFVNDDLVDVWTRFQNSLDSGAVVNVGSDGAAAQNTFATGGAAMLLASSASLGNVSSVAGFAIEAMPLPVSSPDGGAVPGGSAVWILGEDHSEVERAAALEFATFMSSPTVQAEIFAESGYLPTSVEALETLKGSETDQARLVLLDQFANTSTSIAAGGCHHGAFGQSRETVRTAIQAIAEGQDVRTALEGAQATVTDQLVAYNTRAN